MTSSNDLPDDMRRIAFDPELVERLLDGELEPDDAPEDLAGVAELVQTARAPSTAGELAAEARIVAAMAAVPEDAGGVPLHGRKPMLTRLAHGKAAAIVVLSALGAGAVAAAVTVNRPHERVAAGATTTGPIVVTVPTTEPGPTLPETVPETVPTTEPTTTTSTTTTAAPTTVVAGASEQGRGPDAAGPAAFGLCTAWLAHERNGAQPNGLAFQNLDAAAAAVGQSTQDYCAGVVAAKHGNGGTDNTAGGGTPAASGTAQQTQDKPNGGGGNGPPAGVPGATAPGQGRP